MKHLTLLLQIPWIIFQIIPVVPSFLQSLVHRHLEVIFNILNKKSPSLNLNITMHNSSSISSSIQRLTMQKKIMTIVRMTIMMIIAQMAEPENATVLNFPPKKVNLKTWILHFVEGLEAWRRRSHKIVDSDAKVRSTVTAGIRGPMANGQVHSGENLSFSG